MAGDGLYYAGGLVTKLYKGLMREPLLGALITDNTVRAVVFFSISLKANYLESKSE